MCQRYFNGTLGGRCCYRARGGSDSGDGDDVGVYVGGIVKVVDVVLVVVVLANVVLSGDSGGAVGCGLVVAVLILVEVLVLMVQQVVLLVLVVVICLCRVAGHAGMVLVLLRICMCCGARLHGVGGVLKRGDVPWWRCACW